MLRKAFLALIPVLLAYAILTIYKPTELMAYFFPILCWSIAALTILWICDAKKIREWFNKSVTTTAFLVAAFQISALILAGLFTSFGKSPYAFTPTAIAINITYFMSPIIAMELSRAYLIKSCSRKRIFVGVTLTALFYTFISIPLARFIAPKTPTKTIEFLGSDFLPTFAQSILATYLALLGGPTASIAYLGTLEAFEWLSPILPNPDWTIKALIITLTPAIGFISASQSVSPFKLMRHGIITRHEVTHKTHKTKKFSNLSWITIAIIALILLWGSTGLLGFKPTVIASGSMQPALNIGDIAITVPTSPEKIKVGDIIQYWKAGERAPIIHRVIEINRAEGITYIITKGDANTEPDEPITATKTIDKVALIIPKLGWISIYLKEATAMAWSFFTNNPQAIYALLGAILITSAYGIHKHKNQQLNRLKRRIRR
ncbi:MAG: signal peptidase I [Candidatus Bathyarchaeia archaeon]